MSIKNIFTFIASVLFCVVFSFSAQAGYGGSPGTAAPEWSSDKKPIQVQPMLSTVGFGGNVGYHINDMFFIGADFASASLSDEQEDDKGTVDVDLNFSTQIFMLRVSPFSGSFFIQGGLVTRSWEITGDGESEIGDTGRKGKVKATVKFPSVAANMSVGWNWISDFGLSGGLGLGVISGGKPTVDLDSVDILLNASFTTEEIDKEKENLEEEMAKFSTFPYIHLNIGWNF